MRIMVIFGGKSVEHEVSIISGYQVMGELKDYDLYPVYVTKDNEMIYVPNVKIEDYKNENYILKKGKKINLRKKGFNKYDIDICINVMHGTNGEDGLMASILEYYNIPYTSSHYIGASVGQDKVFMKDILKVNNIKVIDYEYIYDYQINTYVPKIEYPLIIKPSRLGSSVGIKKITNSTELYDGLKECFRLDNKVIIEKYIDNIREINCAFIGDHENVLHSNIEEIINDNDILNYNDKYDSKLSGTKRIIPAKINDVIKNKVIELGNKVMNILNLSGVIRIDYIISNDEIYINEVNTIPGSLAMYLFDNKKEMLQKLMRVGFKKYYHKEKRKYSFNNNILEGKSIKK